MTLLGWIGTAIASALAISLVALFVVRLGSRWRTLSVRRRILYSALVAEFVLGALLLAVERFVTDAPWTWLAFAVLFLAALATERELKRTPRPPVAP